MSQYDEQTEKIVEEAYSRGFCTAHRQMLRYCINALDRDDELHAPTQLVLEREEAIAAIKRLCKRLKIPIDWPDDACLADIIEKHIGETLR